MLFKNDKQMEEILKLYGIETPCEMEFVGDSKEVMFKFTNVKVEDELEIIKE